MDLSRVRQKDMSNITCFRCKKPGHFQKDCKIQINELTSENIQEILRMHLDQGPPPEDPLEVYVVREENEGENDEENVPSVDEDTDTHLSSWSVSDRLKNIYGKDKKDFV